MMNGQGSVKYEYSVSKKRHYDPFGVYERQSNDVYLNGLPSRYQPRQTGVNFRELLSSEQAVR